MADIQNKIEEGLARFQNEIDHGKQKLINSKEINRLKKEIQEASFEKSKILISMGLTTHQFIREGKFDDENLKQLSKAMVQHDKTIYLANKKIAELKVDSKEGTRCECGAIVDENTKFCGNCGKDVTTIVAAKAKNKCDCGANIDSSTKFCGNCGNEIKYTTPEIKEDMIECQTCEKQIPSNSTFCNICGTKVS